MEDSEIIDNIKHKNTWFRGAFMLLFVMLYSVAEIVMLAVVVTQFVFSLFTRNPNSQLSRFGLQLSTYLFSIFRYLTFNTEQKPFPFDTWPTVGDAKILVSAADATEKTSADDAEQAKT